VHIATPDNVLLEFPAAVAGLEGASSSAWMPSNAMVFFTRAMGRKRLPVYLRVACRLVTTCYLSFAAWEFRVVSRLFFASLCTILQCSGFIYYRLLDIVTLGSPLFPYFSCPRAHGFKMHFTNHRRHHDRGK
jgi:hypothetical protein